MDKFRKFRVVLGFIVSGICLLLILRKIDIFETMNAVRRADYYIVILGSCATIVVNILRSLRWRYLTENHKLVPSRFFIKAFFIGFLANSVLPARLGEIVRAKSLGDLSKSVIKTGGTKSLSSIFLERVFDGLILLIFLVGFTLFSPIPGWMRRIGWIAAIVFISLFFFIILILFYKEIVRKILGKLLFWIDNAQRVRILNMFNWFAEGLGIIKNSRNMIPFIVSSIIIWLAEGLIIFVFIRSLNIDVPIVSGYFVMTLIGFGIAIPSAPGYIGVYQFMCIKGLSIWGVNESLALSFSLVMQFATYIPMNLIGLGFLMSSKMPFNTKVIPKAK